jgi:hypothetical protein
LVLAVLPEQVTPIMARTVQRHHLAQFLLAVATVAVQTHPDAQVVHQ